MLSFHGRVTFESNLNLKYLLCYYKQYQNKKAGFSNDNYITRLSTASRPRPQKRSRSGLYSKLPDIMLSVGDIALNPSLRKSKCA